MKTICELLTIHVKDTAHEAYLESSQTYMMKFFGENSYCHGSKYASEPQYLLYNTDDKTTLPSSEIHVIRTIWKT